MPSVKKRGGLGRGLNALVSEAEYETGGSATSAANTASEVNGTRTWTCYHASQSKLLLHPESNTVT